MKHSTPDQIKFKKLQRRLGVPRYAAAGILEMLWITTQKNAPRGDIGKFDNESLAIEMDWAGDPDELIELLTVTGWLDLDKEHRLVVHNWAQHAPRYIHGIVSKIGGFVEATSTTTVPDCSDGLQSPTTVPVETVDSQGQRNLTKPNVTKPNVTKPIAPPAARTKIKPRCPDSYTTDFEAWWAVWAPHRGRKSKRTAFKAWFKAVERVPMPDGPFSGLRAEAARDFLKEQAVLYCLSPLGQSEYHLDASTWLNGDGFLETEADWQRGDDNGTNGKGNAGNARVPANSEFAREARNAASFRAVFGDDWESDSDALLLEGPDGTDTAPA